MATQDTALVLGATGGIGGEVARQLVDAGWTVRALSRRHVPVGDDTPGISWITGDALNRHEVMAAAEGCSVIVHAVNPPGYRRWASLVLPMLDNSIEAAIAQGATLVLPGTTYNFGPDAFPVLTEDSPQHPLTRKGAIRVELERRLFDATGSGARVIIVRAGDFFGPRAGNNWFSQGLVKPGKPVGKIIYPGAPGIGHQWGYLPDVARTMVELLARREALGPFSCFHMAGHWDGDGTALTGAICRAVHRHAGRPARVVGLPWWLLTLASPFVETFREMREMRYLWQTPIRMDNAKLVATLGYEPHTPIDEAVVATLVGIGALDPMPAAPGLA
ncbi:NAD(P)H-binding protein [Pseudoxanthomonas sp.]|uniref:NAD(P)H-binding protein n=1 Tax=Pseudoxanthomonas sp. TaxID=1871049 RepID=UPI0026319BC3|nr:NAD(P)H-binding protein [Pseudoxanthomonas sp.]WDS37017.1 MAG: NAD(P)H-binding protein [Pseudoxanthomonas sp.]